jgi:molecular chaperone DnaK (HSP70)
MVFGISIGSTTLSNAVVASGRAQVVANADGHHRPRAVVAKVENEFCVGTAALSARNTPLFKNILKEFIENGPTHMIQCQVISYIKLYFSAK